MTPRILLGVRAVQAALVVACLFAAFAVADRSIATESSGSDRLAVDVAATLAQARGPWPAGHVFTERDAGILLNDTGTWVITAQHAVTGIVAEPVAWRATVQMRELGGEGREWWSRATPLTVTETNGTARILLDAAAIAREARALDDAANATGRPSITVIISHDARILVAGVWQPITRTSTFDLLIDRDFAILTEREGGGTYSRVVEAGTPWLPILFGASAAALELPCRSLTRRIPAWERIRGVRVVPVSDLPWPLTAVTCAIEDLARLAKDAGGAMLVDRHQGFARIPGDPSLVAFLSPSSRPELPPAGTAGPAAPDLGEATEESAEAPPDPSPAAPKEP